jgi:hypothetical protein
MYVRPLPRVNHPFDFAGAGIPGAHSPPAAFAICVNTLLATVEISFRPLDR